MELNQVAADLNQKYVEKFLTEIQQTIVIEDSSLTEEIPNVVEEV